MCRYYNGESEPPRSLPEGCALMWDYEWHWVLWSLKNDSMMEQFQRMIEEFHLENKDDDRTPLTMKALLLNRYLHWCGAYASIEETLKHFEKWYMDHYLIRSTNEERKAYASPIFGISRHRMGVDGKGVTTLVTFMGCPLKCRYCLKCYKCGSKEVESAKGRYCKKFVETIYRLGSPFENQTAQQSCVKKVPNHAQILYDSPKTQGKLKKRCDYFFPSFTF